jgi:hypothetical protein
LVVLDNAPLWLADRIAAWPPALRRRPADAGFSDRAYAIKVFAEHNAEVVREAPADRLLVISAGAGWDPLCAFLGVPVPDEPYPHLNDPERFWARVQARIDETRP